MAALGVLATEAELAPPPFPFPFPVSEGVASEGGAVVAAAVEPAIAAVIKKIVKYIPHLKFIFFLN